MQVPAFHGPSSFNAHHSPMGAFFSFTCGNFGTRGGLAAQLGRPADQDVYIGVKEGDRFSPAPLKCLPFYEGAQGAPDAAQAYLVEQTAALDGGGGGGGGGAKEPPPVTAYTREEISRFYAWATDTWRTPDFEFSIFSPFDSIPDPAVSSSATMRAALIPAVTGELIIDNRQGTHTKTGFFSLGFRESGVRELDEGLPKGRVGFALRSHLGFAAELVELKADGTLLGSDETGAYPFAFMTWTPAAGLANRDNPIHLLGSCPGVGFEVPAGKRYILRLAFGCYLEGNVTTRLEGRYLYTRYFANLQDVLNEALAYVRFVKVDCNTLNDKLLLGGLNLDQQFLIAHATRSYYGSTQLLEVAGQPYWIVNEGEYCMLNTLDLSVDQLFWELRWNPWVVRNLLDNFARYYSYQDQVKDPKTGQLYPGGISFAHDQGVHNQFAPFGRSSYELTNLKGCFSQMTQEQLCNWILMATSYVAKTGDMEWLHRQMATIKACLRSMRHRDHPLDVAARQGIMQFDSARCGTGSEITTYDSLDESLGQARNNIYLAGKCWASYLGLAYLLERGSGFDADSQAWSVNARTYAQRTADLLAKALGPDGCIPAVLEPENPGRTSRILPAIEGVVYPLYWNAVGNVPSPADDAGFAAYLAALRTHTVTLLKDPAHRNRFADGGIKLSSSSNNSWASKIALFEHVAREVFNLDESGDLRPHQGDADGWEKSDAAHRQWQTEGPSTYWACSDQMVNGVATGSKYYPRIVTTVLWTKEL